DSQRAQGQYFHGVLFVSSRREVVAFGMVPLDRTSHETLTGFMTADLSQREVGTGGLFDLRFNLPKPRRTWLICRDKIDEAAKPKRTPMAIMMPQADKAVLARRAAIVAALRAIVPGEGVID